MFGVDLSGSRAHLCSSADLHHTAVHHHHSRERPDKEQLHLSESEEPGVREQSHFSE